MTLPAKLRNREKRLLWRIRRIRLPLLEKRGLQSYVGGRVFLVLFLVSSILALRDNPWLGHRFLLVEWHSANGYIAG